MFQSAKAFIDAFDIGNSDSYFDPVELTDTKFGFSVKRKYPESISYKPAYKPDGQPDNVAVIWVVLRENMVANDGRQPLTLRIANYKLSSRLFSDFDENDQNTPTKESILASEKTPQPAELENSKDFYYDPVANRLVNKRGQLINGASILDEIFQEHCDTVHPAKGLELKFKRQVLGGLDGFFIFLIWLQKILLEEIFCYKLGYKEGYSLPVSLTLYKFTDIKKTEGEVFEFFEWKAHKPTIVIFCTLVVLLYIGSYFDLWNLKYLESIDDNNFLILVHVICAVFVLETLPVRVLFPLLNQTIKFRARLKFSKLNPFTYKYWFLPLVIIVMAGLLILIFPNL